MTINLTDPANQLTAFRADGGDISQGRIKEIADNAYGDEEKRRLAQRLLGVEADLQEHQKAAALHFQRGYDDGHSRGLTCGRLYKTDDQMRMHRAECVAAYKAELRGEESDE